MSIHIEIDSKEIDFRKKEKIGDKRSSDGTPR